MKATSMKNLISLIAALTFLTSFAFAQDEKKKAKPAEKEAAVEVEKDDPAANEDVVKITLGINPANPMMYDKDKLEVPAGEKIQLTFENTGALPKMAGGHNVVILKKGVDMVAFASATGLATMQNAQGLNKKYLTDEQIKQTIAYSKVLGPKEKDVITFTAPEEPGEYDYVCSFIAHFATMKGKLIVK